MSAAVETSQNSRTAPGSSSDSIKGASDESFIPYPVASGSSKDSQTTPGKDYLTPALAQQTPTLKPALEENIKEKPKVIVDPNGYGKPDEKGIVAGEDFMDTEGTGISEDVDLYEGRLNSIATREPREKRPPTIEKYWKSLYPHVRFWWEKSGNDLNRHQTDTVKEVQENISNECHRLALDQWNSNGTEYAAIIEKNVAQEIGSDGRSEPDQSEESIRRAATNKLFTELKKSLQYQYQFPDKDLWGHITAIKGVLAVLLNKEASQPAVGADEELKAYDAEISRVKVQLLKGVAVFQERLKGYDIDLQKVVSTSARETFLKIAMESKESAEAWKNALIELNKPTKEHEAVWAAATPEMQRAVSVVLSPFSKEAGKTLGTALRKLEEHDKQILATNGSAHIVETTNCLPIPILQQMAEDWENGNESSLDDHMQAFLLQLEYQSVSQELLQALKPATREKDQTTNSNLSKGPSGTSGRSVNMPKSLSPFPAAAAANTTMPAATQPGKLAMGTNLTEDMLRNIDLNSLSLSACVANLFQYKDGMTEYGPLEATRASSTDNARLNRYFVNAGLNVKGYEYYKVFKGSDLGPGGAEKLSGQKVVEFDLKQRKKDVKDLHPILSVGPCVVMPRAEDYVRRGTKERRPDTYIRVVYEGKPLPEWLSRTEFTQLAGPRYGGRMFTKYVGEYMARQVYFEAHKIQKLHPMTREPLGSDDLQNTPWLFPEELQNSVKTESTNGSIKTQDDDDEDVLKGATFDSGALPAEITDAFKKDRLDLSHVSKMSSKSAGQL
jgi:hypothetical protein